MNIVTVNYSSSFAVFEYMNYTVEEIEYEGVGRQSKYEFKETSIFESYGFYTLIVLAMSYFLGSCIIYCSNKRKR